MNLQCDLSVKPLRVLIVNSMCPAAKFLVVKILTGEIFGRNQLIDITLMVYSNEEARAAGLKFELEKCALACTNSIKVTSNLPSFTDADVFCFITNFPNPNMLNLHTTMNDEKQLDVLDLIINIATNLRGPVKEEQAAEIAQKNEKIKRKHTVVTEKKPCKPIFIADGLVAIHVLLSFSTNLPSDIFYCPTPIPAIAKSVLGDHLKVQCKDLNDVLVWAADDKIFHVEFKKPLIIHDKVGEASSCDWETVGKGVLASMNLDHMQFNSAWMKKDLIAKTSTMSQKNPYGNIYKAALVAKTLQQIWSSRLTNDDKIYTNLGVVSDGSLETIKGYPYVLPVIFSGDTWRVNTRFEKDVHLKQEIKKINKTVKDFHDKLKPFCNKLMFESVSSSLCSVEEEESQQDVPYFPRGRSSQL